MGISHIMPYAAAVASVPAKGATMSGYRFRLFCLAGLLSAMLGASLTPAAAPDLPWPGLVQDIFNNRPMNDGAEIIAIEMPYRAEDAAIVPVTLRTKLPPGDSRRVLRITLVIDQNPAPLAAKFELGPDAQRFGNLDARAHQQLYRRSRGGRAERRQALYGQDLCEGVRRLLRARRQERRRRQEPDWARCDTANSRGPARVLPAALARRRS